MILSRLNRPSSVAMRFEDIFQDRRLIPDKAKCQRVWVISWVTAILELALAL
jgi:hypothetical protein